MNWNRSGWARDGERRTRRHAPRRGPRLESLERRALLATFQVTTLADAGAGSLRQAILDANASAGADQVVFNIIGTGIQTITPLSPLPTVTDPVTIDGTSQPGSGTTPRIEISGASAGPGANGLTITAGSSTVKGLTINRFGGAAIQLANVGGNLITGNFVGVNAAGTASAPNARGVDILNSPNNTIGGTAAGTPNVIAGNTGNGIVLTGATALANVIQGNAIGTNLGGTTPLPNVAAGIRIDLAEGTQVGGTTPGAGNTIAFNGGPGVQIVGGDANAVIRNAIFTNTAKGIELTAGANNNQAAPVLTSVTTTGGTTTVAGTVSGIPNLSYTIDLYANTSAASTSTDSGRTFVGSLSATTNASGVATFSGSTSTAVALNTFVTALATDPFGNTSEFSNAVQNSPPTANLAITGTVQPNPAAQGGVATYTFTFTNPGPSVATNVAFTDILPSTLSFVMATASQGTVTRSGSAVTAAIGTLGVGSTATVTVQAVPTITGTISNTGTVTATEDRDTANNSVTLPLTVQQGINLSVSGQAIPSPAQIGDQIALRYTVTNSGAAQATNVVLTTGALPPGFTFVSSTTSQGTTSATGGVVTANLGTLAPNASAVVTVAAQTSASGTFTQTASVSGTGVEVDPTNNATTLAIVVAQTPPVPPVTTGPTVTAVTRFGFHTMPTSLLINFSEPLDLTSAQNAANYLIAIPGRDGRLGTGDDRALTVQEVTYQPASRSVIVTTRHRLDLNSLYQLTVVGTSPGGVRNLNGVLLNGSGAGAGTNFVTTFRGLGAGSLPTTGSRPLPLRSASRGPLGLAARRALATSTRGR